MFIWTGLGFLVPLLGYFSMMGGHYLAIEIADGKASELMINNYEAAGLLFAAAVNWILGISLEKYDTKKYVNKKTGEVVIEKPSNTLFFIPMQYYSIVLVLLSVLYFYINFYE